MHFIIYSSKIFAGSAHAQHARNFGPDQVAFGRTSIFLVMSLAISPLKMNETSCSEHSMTCYLAIGRALLNISASYFTAESSSHPSSQLKLQRSPKEEGRREGRLRGGSPTTRVQCNVSHAAAKSRQLRVQDLLAFERPKRCMKGSDIRFCCLSAQRRGAL